jgi:hypothetical protein
MIGLGAGKNNSGQSVVLLGGSEDGGYYGAGHNNTGSSVNAIGSGAGSSNTGSYVNAIGSGAANYNTKSYRTIIDVFNRNDETDQDTSALIYGVHAEVPDSQRLYINGTADINSMVASIRTTTSHSMITNSDYTILIDATSAVTDTLPDAATCKGRIYKIKAINVTSTAKVVTEGGNIDGASAFTFNTIMQSIEIQSDGANYYIMSFYMGQVS